MVDGELATPRTGLYLRPIRGGGEYERRFRGRGRTGFKWPPNHGWRLPQLTNSGKIPPTPPFSPQPGYFGHAPSPPDWEAKQQGSGYPVLCPGGRATDRPKTRSTRTGVTTPKTYLEPMRASWPALVFGGICSCGCVWGHE